MTEVKFYVPGPVVGKMRARVGTIAGKARMFTPGKTANYENLIKHAANAAMVGAGRGSLIDGPCQCNILVGVQVPASWSKKKREQALQGLIAPTSKPDLDNVVKSAMDGMNGIVWTDDSRCVTLIAKKRFREVPGLWVTVIDLVAMQPVMGEAPKKDEYPVGVTPPWHATHESFEYCDKEGRIYRAKGLQRSTPLETA